MTGLPTRSQLASVLALVAVLAVLSSGTVTAAAYLRRDGAAAVAGRADAVGSPSERARPSGFAGGREVVGRGAGARFEVPPTGWTRQRDTVLYYVDRHGERSVAVADPAVFRAGYCPGRATSNRGFAGFTRPPAGSAVGRSVRVANRALARRWVRAVALAADLVTRRPHTPLRTVARTLADGTEAVRSTARVAVDDAGRCGAPEVAVTLLSLPTGKGVAHLVLVRDAGAAGTLSGRMAERIVETARPLPG